MSVNEQELYGAEGFQPEIQVEEAPEYLHLDYSSDHSDNAVLSCPSRPCLHMFSCHFMTPGMAHQFVILHHLVMKMNMIFIKINKNIFLSI